MIVLRNPDFEQVGQIGRVRCKLAEITSRRLQTSPMNIVEILGKFYQAIALGSLSVCLCTPQ